MKVGLNGVESGVLQTEDELRACTKAQQNTIRINLNYQSHKAALEGQKSGAHVPFKNSFFVTS